jgi:uncharacterized membrane protein
MLQEQGYLDSQSACLSMLVSRYATWIAFVLAFFDWLAHRRFMKATWIYSLRACLLACFSMITLLNDSVFIYRVAMDGSIISARLLLELLHAALFKVKNLHMFLFTYYASVQPIPSHLKMLLLHHHCIHSLPFI